MRIFSTVLFIFLFINTAFASQYAVIVDAGSTGSKLHLFQYDSDTNIPIIMDIFTKKNSIPLASFSSNPSIAGESLQPLLDGAVNQLQEKKTAFPVTISVLGTAGMRLLSLDDQTAIYQNVKDYIEKNYSQVFLDVDIETLPGQMEALYDWFDVNYLAKNFQNNTNSVGTLDMGGASTQIAFVMEDNVSSNDEISVKVNGKSYRVFAKSFLGLGLDQARYTMNENQNAISCYPLDAPYQTNMSGNFNLDTCRSIYTKIIHDQNVSDQIPSVNHVQTFIAFSGAYYTYQFFGIGSEPPAKEVIEQQYIAPLCYKNWDTLKSLYPNEPEQYLINYCANGVYITDLYFDAYKIQNNQLRILSQIDGQNIDWTLGAMLNYAINP